MSSIQERLQQQRVPLDTWNLREQLCLASAVVRSGDQNWMSVSRALKTVSEPNRPPDWYSQKSCAAQYGVLLEHVETPKRKKRCVEGAVETPQESILKRLTQERIAEIQKTIVEMNQQYEQLKAEITEVRSQSTSEDRLREIWAAIESGKRAKERESARRAALMKEREDKRSRTWRPPVSTTPTSPAATPTTPSSPLLTSLLKSSPVVTTPQHISHPASVVDVVSPSVTAPTLSMLLERGSEHKHAAIEHIKSQLQQIEHQLKAKSSPPPLAAPSVDIDDIEIKAEDVYAFRDIDLHLPVSSMHKGPRAEEKSVEKKVEEEEETIEVETVDPQEEVKEEPMAVEEVEEATVDVESETAEETSVEEIPEETPVEPPEPPVAFPGVRFPTTEIKVIQDTPVIQPEEIKIKEEEPTEPEPDVTCEESQPEPEPEVEIEKEVVHGEDSIVDVVEEEISVEPPPPSPEPIAQPIEIAQQVEQPVAQPVEVEETIPLEEEVVDPDPDPQDIPLPPEPEPEPVVEASEVLPSPELEEPPVPEPEPEIALETEPEIEETEVSNDVASVEETTEEDLKKDDDSEDSIPLKQMIREESLRTSEPGALHAADTHTETDDDTPMEVSREEEKDGKKRRDYSRKKKPDSRACSGSESAAEGSAPESPRAGGGGGAAAAGGGDADRQHRLWKKSVMLVYSRLCAHKFASLFVRPISDEEAPGYSAVVKRPMDLTAIRRHIDNGQIRNTAEFQRDVLLMLSNALLYNSSEHSVYTMAKEMHEEAACQLGMLLAAQAHAGLIEAPPRRKRRRYDDARNKRI